MTCGLNVSYTWPNNLVMEPVAYGLSWMKCYRDLGRRQSLPTCGLSLFKRFRAIKGRSYSIIKRPFWYSARCLLRIWEGITKLSDSRTIKTLRKKHNEIQAVACLGKKTKRFNNFVASLLQKGKQLFSWRITIYKAGCLRIYIRSVISISE